MEILLDFIFIVCVFFSRALGVYRTAYADATEITPSASKSLGLLLRVQGGFGAINVEINARLAKKG